MAHNSRGDHFIVGVSEREQIRMMTVAKLKRLDSGDYPGKKVGAVLGTKRKSGHHAERVEKIQAGEEIDPVIVRDGALIDGHHRVAAAEDADKRLVPTRTITSAAARLRRLR